MLAVQDFGNRWLEKVWGQLPALRAARITDPDWVAKTDLDVIITALRSCGFDRGKLSGLVVGRFQTGMKAVAEGTLDRLPALLQKGDDVAAIELLDSVPGIGPAVAKKTLWLLEDE